MEARDLAERYIKSLTVNELSNVRTMLRYGILCGKGYADRYGLDETLFTSQLKEILGVRNV